MLKTIITAAVVVAAASTDVPLCRFDAKGPTMKWVQKNDPGKYLCF